MRVLAQIIAILAALGLGAWAATLADDYLILWTKIPAGDRRIQLGQGAVALGVAYFVGLPLWRVTRFLFPRRRPLIPCPDCDGLVSKLATLCPHCGRPLSPLIDSRLDVR